jgi:hypothetical protein
LSYRPLVRHAGFIAPTSARILSICGFFCGYPNDKIALRPIDNLTDPLFRCRRSHANYRKAVNRRSLRETNLPL